MIVIYHPNNFPDKGQLIWRYLSFSKFVALLISHKLHFTRTDLFLDTFESAIPKSDLKTSRDYFATLLDQPIVNVDNVSKFEKSSVREYIGHFLKLSPAEVDLIDEKELPKYMLQISNRFQFVNCWHLNDSESAGMWKLYLDSDDGVAIQTTVGDLLNCMETSKHTIYLGTVEYMDYQKESWGDYHPLNPIFHKRNSFAHERELRAVIVNPPDIDPKKTNGVLVNVNLKHLIKNILVSPKAGTWFIETVADVSSVYGVHIDPVQSQLYDQPLF